MECNRSMNEGGNNMKKLFFGIIFLALVGVFPAMTMAAIDISIGISLPPPIIFGAPPDVIVMPDTDDVYVVPDIDVDLFFWNGWWWRLWEGRWYRSRYYNRGWGYYTNVPSFYFDVDPGWRGYYSDHNWYGHRWDYERVPNRQLQQNWRSWQNNRRWERQGTWGVQSYQPRPRQQRLELRQERQQQYQQRPQVQQPRRQLQERVQPQTQPQVQQPRRQLQERVQPQTQPQVQQPRRQLQERVQPQTQPQVQRPQRSQTKGKPEERKEEHIK